MMLKSNSDWTITGPETDAWLTVTPPSGFGDALVTVTVAENTSSSKRRSVLLAQTGGTSREIVIEQAALELAMLTIENAPGEFDAGGGSGSFDIVCNTDWTISQDAAVKWVTVSKDSGTGNSAITVTVAANETTRERKTTLTVAAGSIRSNVEIVQKPNEEIDFTIDDLTGTWTATGVMIYLNGDRFTAKTQEYRVSMVRKDANTLTISNFGDSDNGHGSGTAGDVSVDATVDTAARTMTIASQELTTWVAGRKTFLSSYDSSDFEATLDKDIPPSAIDATRVGFSVEIRSANPRHPVELLVNLPEVANSQYYSCFTYNTSASSGEYDNWNVIYVDMKFRKAAD